MMLELSHTVPAAAELDFEGGWSLAFDLVRLIEPNFSCAPSPEPAWVTQSTGLYGMLRAADARSGEGGWRVTHEGYATGPAETREVDVWTFTAQGLSEGRSLVLEMRREGHAAMAIASRPVVLTLRAFPSNTSKAALRRGFEEAVQKLELLSRL